MFLTNIIQAEFPELTFCKDGVGYKPEVLRQQGIETSHYAGQIKASIVYCCKIYILSDK